MPQTDSPTERKSQEIDFLAEAHCIHNYLVLYIAATVLRLIIKSGKAIQPCRLMSLALSRGCARHCLRCLFNRGLGVFMNRDASGHSDSAASSTLRPRQVWAVSKDPTVLGRDARRPRPLAQRLGVGEVRTKCSLYIVSRPTCLACSLPGRLLGATTLAKRSTLTFVDTV